MEGIIMKNKENVKKSKASFLIKRKRVKFDAEKAKEDERKMLEKTRLAEFPIGKPLKREFFEPKKKKQQRKKVEENFIMNALQINKEELKTISNKKKFLKTKNLPPIQEKDSDVLKSFEPKDKFDGLQGVKDMENFDYINETKTPEEWVQECLSLTDERNAKTPMYRNQTYKWVDVKVLDYNPKTQRYLVREVKNLNTSQNKLDSRIKPLEKWVKRLSLCFHSENFEDFKNRIEKCKVFLQKSKNKKIFDSLIQNISDSEVNSLPQIFVSKISQRIFNPKKKSKEERMKLKNKNKNSDKIDIETRKMVEKQENMKKDIHSKMISDARKEFQKQMKLFLILDKAKDPNYYKLLQESSVKIHEIDPYFRQNNLEPFKNHFLRNIDQRKGVEKLGIIGNFKGKSDFNTRFEKLKKDPILSNASLTKCMKMFTLSTSEFVKNKLLNFEGIEKHPPFELKKFIFSQEDKFTTNKMSLNGLWREQNIGDITDLLRGIPEFTEAFKQQEDYEKVGHDTLKRFLGKLDLKFKESLMKLFENNIDHYIKFLNKYSIESHLIDFASSMCEKESEFNINDTKIQTLLSMQPLLKVELKFKELEKKRKDKRKKEKLIFLEPTASQIKKKLKMPIEWLKKMINEQQSMEPDIVKMLNLKKVMVTHIPDDHPIVVSAISNISLIIDRAFKEPIQILELYKQYEFLLQKSKEDLVKAHYDSNKKSKNIQKIQNFLQKLRSSIKELHGLTAEEHKGSLFETHSRELRDFMIEKAKKVQEELLKKMNEDFTKNVKELYEKFEKIKNQLILEPKNEREFTNLRNNLKELPERLNKMTEEMESAKNLMTIFEEFGGEFDKNINFQFWLLHVCPLEIKRAAEEGQKIAKTKEEIFMAKLLEEKTKFTDEFNHLVESFQKFTQVNTISNINESAIRNETLNDKLQEALRKVKNFNERENIFNLQKTEYKELNDLNHEMEPFRKLWNVAFQFRTDRESWEQQIILKLTYKEVIKKIESHRRQMKELTRRFQEIENENALKVVEEVQNEMKTFSDKLPIIEWLTKESLVKKINNFKSLFINLQMDCNPNIENLSTLMKKGIMEKIKDIKEFVQKTEQEFSLEKLLNSKVIEILRKTEVQLMEYPSQKTWVLLQPDILQLLLDDLLYLTLSLKQSPFLRNLRKKVEEVEYKLIGFQDLLQIWKLCQRAWMYLEPIFASEDLKKIMPFEKNEFDIVNNVWKEIMNGVQREPCIFENLDWERVKGELNECNNKLDKIKKMLKDYLEKKRSEFQRFYFLSDEELIEIISKTKNPMLVTKYLNKCFEAIENVEFDDKQRVISMMSKKGERVSLLKPISVDFKDKKGSIEKWLKELEDAMKNTLAYLAKQAADDLHTEREKWLFSWPGQIIMIVNRVRWTSEVEEAILKNNLIKFKEKGKKELENIVSMVRGEVSKIDRITLSALITLDVHANHLVDLFINKNVRSIEDFNYVAQLRYYFNNKSNKIFCKMMTAKYDYQYEYLGNTGRLVTTPLTDKCFRTLIEAFNYFYGGAPEGPAGTGKTETVKDLAKGIGVKCDVFNCTDQMNYVAMSKLFKGIAQTGSWICFDEFNLIHPEVLSVIAEQVRTIQNAIKLKQNQFYFEGKNIMLVRSCTVNITMNPNYSGRSSLPDNLKALFRPCAMMIPNYSLIAEISLYSSGFYEASELANKIVTALHLCSEQLSNLKHYDFGMRALKAVLVASAREKRKNLNESEFKLCLKALKDVNLPKFTLNDVSLFEAIISDLFPEVQCPENDYEVLRQQIEINTEKHSLINTNLFQKKCIELYETVSVRHGLMLIGETFSGKTEVLRTLQRSLSIDQPVNIYRINPKAVTRPQLYGFLDPDTKIWTDGVFPAIMKYCENHSETPDLKWIVFDGPVDACWIEKKVRIMFEVEDLAYASLATVSRCGMVYMQPEQLGNVPLIQAFANFYLPEQFTQNLKKMFYIIFNKLFKENLFIKNELQTCSNCLRIMKILIQDLIKKKRTIWEIEEGIIPLSIFSIFWGFVGLIDENNKNKFIPFFEKLLITENMNILWKEIENLTSQNNETLNFDIEQSENLSESDSEVFEFLIEQRRLKITSLNLGTYSIKDLFDLQLNIDNFEWFTWKNENSIFNVESYLEMKYEEIIVPTTDTIRNEYFAKKFLNNKQNFLLTGPTGTAKTVGIQSLLEKNFNCQKKSHLTLNFSGQTSANSVQQLIENKMTTRKGKKGHFGPNENKNLMVLFVDDVNMPTKEECGAQPAVELLRMWLDYGFWYDLDTLEQKFLIDMQIIAAMGPPSTGRNSVSNRFLGHFAILYVSPFGQESLKTVFESLLNWHCKRTPFKYNLEIIKNTSKIINLTIDIYEEIKFCPELRPTPKKTHYVYNLRDISKVIQKITWTDGRSLQKETQFLNLWIHESRRVFMDRLIDEKDRKIFKNIQDKVLKKNLNIDLMSLTKGQEPIWGDFIPFKVNNLNGSMKKLNEIYHQFEDFSELKKTCEDFLEEYNSKYDEKMNLVLFEDAISHIAKILRIIKSPNGHCLLVGMGGLGRKSLTCLAAFIAGYSTFSIEIHRDYSYHKDWSEDLQELMRECALEEKPMIFIFRDTQIFSEEVLEDISTILNKGSVPSVFTSDAKNQLIDLVNQTYPDETVNMNISEKFDFFLEKCKNNLHLSLCFSPADQKFKERLRNFPSLINCSSINWFLDWPKEALKSVANSLIPNLVENKNQMEKVLDLFVYMHHESYELTKKYKDELRKYYFVTPTSYLELLRVFKEILHQRRENTDSDIKRYQIGVQELENSKNEVECKKKEILLMEPKLVEATEKTEKLILDVEKEKKELDSKKKLCEEEEIQCNKEKVQAEELRIYCQKELDNLEPILEEATKTISKVQRAHIDFIKKISKVRPPIEKLFQSLCVLLQPGEIPKKKDPKDPYKKIYDWATPARNIIMAKPEQLIIRLKEFNADNINNLDLNIISQLKEIRASPHFKPNSLSTVSSAAGAIGKFVLAIIEIHEKLQIINPKRQDLRNAELRVQLAENQLTQKKKQLENLMNKLKKSSQKLEQEKKNKEDYEEKIFKCKKQLSAAAQLVVGLETEKINWKTRLDNLKFNSQTLLGDVILSAGIVAYLGVFPIHYRQETIKSWLKKISHTNIKVDFDFKLKNILSDEMKVGNWISQKLPNDDFSVENAIIMSNSDRFPLFVDPQGQALNWIKTKEGENLRIVKPSTNPSQLQTKIAECVEGGFPLLFENAEEKLDPTIISVLSSRSGKKNQTIKLQNRIVNINENFRLYICTKLMRPNYGPEICVIVTMLNFEVTSEGLQDQLLNVLVSREEPNTEKARLNNIKEYHELKQKQKETEEKILNLLFSKDKNLLEDLTLIETLKKSKQEAQDAKVRLKEIEEMKKRLSHIRNFYQPVAFRNSHLFFCVVDLASLGPMYQFSLDWFVSLYRKAIDIEPKVKSTRVEDINERFLNLLFSSVCSSLFEKDKLLFAFLIFMKIQLITKKTNFVDLRKLLVGMIRTNPIKQNPVPDIINDKIFAQLEELSDNDNSFDVIVENMKCNLEFWKNIMEKENLELEDLNLKFLTDFSLVQKMILTRILRPDRIINFIKTAVKETLGDQFEELPQIDLIKSFSESTPKTPLIFILSPGSDPLSEIKKLTDDMGKVITVRVLSLGQGQEQNANKFIKQAMNEGEWVILQNCHLSYKYLSVVEKQLEINEPHPDFRLWLTSMPSNKFPVTILQNGIKLTSEPPQGLKSNTLKNFNSISNRFFENHKSGHFWKKLLYGLILFHSVIQERRKFSSLGWNICYNFSNNDLSISMSQLSSFLSDYDEIPWEGIYTCIGDLNYGGRVTDHMDQRLIMVILKNYINENVLDDSYQFSEFGCFKMESDQSFDEYRKNIKNQFPIDDSPEIFGLHQNANISIGIESSVNLMTKILKLLPRNNSSSGNYNDNEMILLCDNLLSKVPQVFDIEKIKLDYPIKYDDSMNTVLQQELMRYNLLINTLCDSLKQLIKGIKGLILMSPELELISNELYDNKVPQTWSSKAYPSKKSLSAWMEDFLKRIAFMNEWVYLGHPTCYWISGFFFIQSFLTGTKQDFARKNKIPIDQIEFEFEILDTMSEMKHTIMKSDEGNCIYGLYMQGAKWDPIERFVTDSDPRVLFEEMPIIFVKPVRSQDKSRIQKYDCPVYQTSERAGELTSTGHSSNFVINLEVPMKTENEKEYWIKRGVACLCQLDN